MYNFYVLNVSCHMYVAISRISRLSLGKTRKKKNNKRKIITDAEAATEIARVYRGRYECMIVIVYIRVANLILHFLHLF
jgi:hypothetical protein